MSEKKYFVINSHEDGVYLHQLTKEELEAELVEEGSGLDDCEWSDELDVGGLGFVNLMSHGLSIIIKGEIVVPTPKTVVKEWELK